MEIKTCTILASAPMEFSWGYDEENEKCAALKQLLLNLINLWRIEGMNSFVVVLDAGVGLYTAEIIGDLREKDETLSLTCVVPWEEQAAKWTPELRERYFNVQAKCTNVETVSRQRTENCELNARLQAIDLADSVFFVTATADDATLVPAVHYARELEKNVLIFDSGKIDFHN